jgi:hypothetical protein
VVVDWDRQYIRPVTAWFSSPQVREALGAVLSRPYDTERPGITEAAIERGSPLLMDDITRWPGAEALRRRLEDELPAAQARLTWDFYASSALLACPVQTPDGRMLGVLALSAGAFTEEEVRSAGVLADLAAIALDRSELLGREERRTHEELMLNRAVHELGVSLELDDVYRAIVQQAAHLSGASKVMLTRQEPASRDLMVLHSRGFSERVRKARFVVGEGMIGRVAESGEPYASREVDRSKFLPWVIDEEGIRSFAHVPLSIGTRLFGVLTVADERAGLCDDALPRGSRRSAWRRRARSPTRSTSRASGAWRWRSRAVSCPARCPSSRASTPGSCSSHPATPPAAATSSASGGSRPARWRCWWAT